MNLIANLKLLWKRKWLVLLAVLGAATISILAVFQVSPSGISKRSQVEARGSIEILVDSARSPIADARRDLEGLTARAGVFARYISGGNVISQIAKANGIPAKRIDVGGPTPLPGQAPGLEEVPQLNPYGVSIVQSGELPILTLLTRAPTVAKARGLAEAAPAAISNVVETIQDQQKTPPDRRVEFRSLGPARADLVDSSAGKKVAALLFFVLLAIFLFAILALPRIAAAWRTAEPGVGQPEPEDASQVTPEVVHLAHGQTGGDAPDPDVTRIRQQGEH